MTVPSKNLRKVVETYIIDVICNGKKCTITIPRDFYYDGASIPCYLWIAFGTPYDCKNDTPGCVHDYLYSRSSDNRVVCDGMEITLDRRATDKIFKNLLHMNGVSIVKSYIM